MQEICVWPLVLLPEFSYRLNRTRDPYIVVLTAYLMEHLAHFFLQPPFHPEVVQARSLELFDCNLYRAINISLRWPAGWWDVKVQELTAVFWLAFFVPLTFNAVSVLVAFLVPWQLMQSVFSLVFLFPSQLMLSRRISKGRQSFQNLSWNVDSTGYYQYIKSTIQKNPQSCIFKIPEEHNTTRTIPNNQVPNCVLYMRHTCTTWNNMACYLNIPRFVCLMQHEFHSSLNMWYWHIIFRVCVWST